LIRENKVAQMYSVIQTSRAEGMQTLDQCLNEMVRNRQISMDEARNKAANKDAFTGAAMSAAAAGGGGPASFGANR
jgi:twitching motility protein PilT